MSRPLLFNPSRVATGELEATFVARSALVEEIVSALTADADGPTVRHWLVVAPRGSGKSHLVELIARRLRATAGWSVARLPEEAYRVRSVADLLLSVVAGLQGVDRPFPDEADRARREALAEGFIRRWRAEKGPILVILENLAELLDRRFDRKEQALLRALLMGDPPFVLLATSVRMTGAILDHSAPFYDFFQERRLEDLSPPQVVELVKRRAAWDQEQAITDGGAALTSRLYALHHLSGGNPRLVLALYQVLRQGLTRDLYDQLLQLLDEVTPYYQARLADSSPQGEQVLVEMALAEGTLTPSEIGRRVGWKTSTVTAVLAQLEQARFARPGGRPEDKRARYWEMTDRLFRIWLQMREGGDADTVRWIVEFYRGWYGEDQAEMVADAGRLVEEACTDGAWADLAKTLAHMEAALPAVREVWARHAEQVAGHAQEVRAAWDKATEAERRTLDYPMIFSPEVDDFVADSFGRLAAVGDLEAMSALMHRIARGPRFGAEAVAVLADRLSRVRDASLLRHLVLLHRPLPGPIEGASEPDIEPVDDLFAHAMIGRLEGVHPSSLGLGDLAPIAGLLEPVLGPGLSLLSYFHGERIDPTLAARLRTRLGTPPLVLGFANALLHAVPAQVAASTTDEEAADRQSIVPERFAVAHAVGHLHRARRFGAQHRAARPFPVTADQVASDWDQTFSRWRLGAPPGPTRVRLHAELVAAGLMPAHRHPWSEAAAVLQAQDTDAALAALHPEVREAVLLLLRDG